MCQYASKHALHLSLCRTIVSCDLGRKVPIDPLQAPLQVDLRTPPRHISTLSPVHSNKVRSYAHSHCPEHRLRIHLMAQADHYLLSLTRDKPCSDRGVRQLH